MADLTANTTEQLHGKALGLDRLPLDLVAGILADGQQEAAAVVRLGAPQMASAARVMAETIRNGGTLYYIAAGSSGLMAAADAMELGGTFSIPATQVRILMAGGIPTAPDMPGDSEDQSDELVRALSPLAPKDTVITVSASGSTPYTLAAAGIAKDAGATVIGIANNARSPLLDLADYPICLPTPPEVLSGSTRMGAGTAQKIALNTLSTLMAVDLGHVHDGMMVNLHADNAKLRARATGIVARISGQTDAAAKDALQRAGGDVKRAILIATGATPDQATDLITRTNGHLRPALSVLTKE
ncbi:N-acetylmuramic acid 6-phosphate etherase [Aliiroseovarius crassostreae]|uniref:N-acetylmuramic acid 6-phosphate etherase n=1 Tax=Aliiroseovarius crassostreae TaxID=154981 RepID=UPI003C7CE0DC